MPRSRTKTSPGIPFIHAADLRLDLPPAGLRRLPASVTAAVRDAPLDALDALVDLAITRAVAFVAISGGIADRRVRDVRSRQRLERAMTRLDEAQIPVFIALGPDDPRGAWPGLSDLPDNVTVFPDQRTISTTIERDGLPVFVVHGRSVAATADLPKAVASFARSGTDGLQVGVLPVPGGPAALATAAGPAGLLAAAGMDYWALGDTPDLRIVSDRDPWVVFPGSTQGRGVTGAELGQKGALVVEVRAGIAQQPELVGLDRVRIVQVPVDAGSHKDLGGIAGDLVLRVSRELGTPGGHGVIARAVIRGEGPLAASFHAAGRGDELLTQLRDLSAGREPFLWWDSVINETAPRYRRAAFASRGDLAAQVVAELDALASDDAGRRALLAAVERAVGAGTPKDGLVLTPEDETRILLEAEQLVLAALEEPAS